MTELQICKACYHSHINDVHSSDNTKVTGQFPYNVNNTGYSISTIFNAYGLRPSIKKDVKVGIIELGGGYLISDLENSMKNNGFPNWKANEHVFPYFLNGYPTNVEQNFYNDLQSSTEVELDIEVVTYAIPNGRINVYFTPGTSYANFIDAVDMAINHKCTTISISWGSFEYQIDNNSIFAFEQVLKKGRDKGISIFVATGDHGDITQITPIIQNNILGYQVGYPASSPNVIACGGTNLSLELCNGTYSKYSKETSWIELSGTSSWVGNGGLSMYFNKPEYQKKVNFNSTNINQNSNKRGVPDVSGNASILNGWLIFFNGVVIRIGGTSAVAPMWAGFTAGLGCNVFLNNYLYNLPKECFHDITAGINYPYEASKGYDLCTGIGSPNGKILVKYLLRIFNRKKCNRKKCNNKKCNNKKKCNRL